MARRALRVLVEHENPRVLEARASGLREARSLVDTCRGPGLLPGGGCPLVMHGDCPEAMAADLIVNGLSVGRLSVYLAERNRLPDIAVLLGLAGVEQDQLPGLGDGVRVAPRDLTGPAVVEAVRQVADP